MKSGEAVRLIMNNKDISVTKLADRMGRSSRLVCDRIAAKNIIMNNLAEMLRVMDYKIVVVPSDTKLQDDWFEID